MSESPFQIMSASHKPLVTLTPDGSVVLGDGINVDEAARAFWDSVTEYAAQMIEHIRAEEQNRIVQAIKATEAKLNDRDDYCSDDYRCGMSDAADIAAVPTSSVEQS